MARERKIAETSNQVEALVTYAAYSSRMMEEIDRLEVHLKRLDAKIEKAQEDMREAFSEQKKAEIIQERREAEELAEREAKESKNLDDIGIEAFRRAEDR